MVDFPQTEAGKRVTFNKLDADVQNLIKESVRIRSNAYCPYSNFKVGAALLTDSGNTYVGCNVENISYGVGICAERSAVCNAISSGDKAIKIIAVCADSYKGTVSPCGACRQFIAEFSQNKDIIIYLTDSELKNIIETTVMKLLPLAFTGIFTGCNIENASFGATICAERTAILKAVSGGADIK